MSQSAPGFNIEQVLINEANRIGPDIYRKTLNTSPWLKLVKKDSWPDEMGDTVRVLTYERSLPSNTLNWSSISVNGVTSTDGSYDNGTSAITGNSSANQLPTAQRIEFAQTLRSYNLTHTALESPKLSVNDLRFSLKRKEQLSNIFSILQENTSYAWQDRYRDEYIRIAQTKITAVESGSTGKLVESSGDGSTFNTLVPPNLPLTQGMLDRVYMKLIRDGGGNNPMERENARPVFGAIMSSETSRNLIVRNPDIRQDYRYSDSKNTLLAPLGITRSYGGFFHLVDDWLPRHDLITVSSVSSGNTLTVGSGLIPGTIDVGDQLSGNGIALGTYVTAASGTSVTLSKAVNGATGTKIHVRRMPYKAVATTQGNKFDINPAYETAAYEDTIIFHEEVFSCLVPKPLTSAGSGVNFDAVSYMGDFKWKNIPHATENPDSTIGYFRAVLSAGSKPVRPEWGTVIRAVRSNTALNVDPATSSANLDNQIFA